jgi:pilus assembly protein CpaF
LLRLGDRVFDEIVGAGPLAALLADPQVTDVVVNGPAEVWIDRGNGMVRASACFSDAESVRRLAQRLAASCGRRLDDGCPYVDARLSDGTRLHAVLPPIAVRGPYLSRRSRWPSSPPSARWIRTPLCCWPRSLGRAWPTW